MMKRLLLSLAASLLLLALVLMLPPGLRVYAAQGSTPVLDPAATATPTPTPTPTQAPTPTPTPVPTPTPTSNPGPPQSPSIDLSSSSGPAGTELLVSGTDFTPGSQVEVFIDTPNRPMGPTFTAGQDGSFQQQESVPDGETAGTHNVCATAQVSPVCAQFTVLAGVPVTPTPTSVPTPTPTPTPRATPTPRVTATPVAISDVPQASKSALDSLFPWILIPILALLLIGAAAVYMIVRGGGDAKPVISRPTSGAGIPVVTHLSPKSGGSSSGAQPAEDELSSLPPEGYSDPHGQAGPAPYDQVGPPPVELLPPPTQPAPPPLVLDYEESPAAAEEPEPPPAPEPPAVLPGPRPQLPGAGGEPPRAAGGDEDVDLPEPSE